MRGFRRRIARGPLLLKAGMRGFGALVLTVTAVVVAAPTASAHDALVSMSPQAGSLVMTQPASVVLTFDEPVQDIGAAVVVTAPSGTRVQSGPPRIVDNIVTQPLTAMTEPGHYTVAYRIVSADGHPVAKEVGFDFLATGTPSVSAATSTATDELAGAQAPWVILALVAVVVIGGGAVLVWRRRRRQAEL